MGNWKKLVAAAIAVPMLAAALPATTAMAAGSSDGTLLADFTFDALADGATGEITDATGKAKAVIQGAASTGHNTVNDTAAANIGSGFWLNATAADGSALLKGKHDITISYDSKIASKGWPFFAAPNANRQTYNSEHYLGVLEDTGSVRVEKYNNNGGRKDEDVVLREGLANEWRHVSIVITDEKSELYVDGQLVDQNKPVSGTLADILGETGGILQIGKANWENGEYFTGLLDNVKIYDGALDAEGIAADYAARTVKTDGPARPELSVLEETGAVTVPDGDANATIVDDGEFGKVVTIAGGWISGSQADGMPVKGVAAFADPTMFNKTEWTLNADVRVTDGETVADNWNKKDAFTIGVKGQAVNLMLGNGKLGYGNTDNGYSGKTVDLSKQATAGDWAAVSVVYTENDKSGVITVYMDGEQVLDATEIGFKLSEQQGTQAYIGHGFQTSFTLDGQYDNITVADWAATAAEAKADTAKRAEAKWASAAIPGAGEHGNNGYLWLNFKATDYEKVNFGYSADGYAWKMLNDGDSVMDSDKGTKGIRDPHLIKLRTPDADGNQYVMIGTDLHAEGSASGGSWDQISASTDLVVAKSKDLVNWSEPQLVSTGLEGKVGNAWAPEAIWDEETNDYLVYWSSRDLSTGGDKPTTGNTALKVYKAHTTDFTSFQDPTVWLDQSSVDMHNIIDTTIVRGDDGDYYRFSTSDWWTTIDVASSLDGDWTRLIERDSDIDSGKSKVTGDQVRSTTASGLSGHIEGLTVYQLNSGKWMVMGDNGGYKGFVIDRLSDLKKGRSFAAASGVTFSEKFRHGTVVELTEAERKAVIAAYGTDEMPPVEPDAEGAGPIAQYDFEDADQPGKDVSGKNNQLTFKGKASVKSDAKKGNVLYLDGGSTSSEAYAEFPKGLFDGRNKLTVSMDVMSEINTNQFTFTFGKNSNVYYFLKYNNSGELASRITTQSYTNESAANASISGNGAWHKVTVTLDDNVMTLYCDGVQVAQNTATNTKVTDLGRNLIAYLGKSFYSDPYFKGAFDNVTVWNRVLSADEIMKASPAALQSITAGKTPTSEEANALRGTDDHTLVRVDVDEDNRTAAPVLNNRADLTASPLTLNFNRTDGVTLTLDGAEFANGSDVDMTKEHTLVIRYENGDEEQWTIKAATVSNNPVLPGQYADPDIDYFDGKFWLYPTTDGFSGWSGNYFHAFSSTDLVNWTDEGVILDVDQSHEGQPQDYWTEQTTVSPWSVGSAWAPTIEKKVIDGQSKYFFYYCAKYPNGESAIGVAVADNPAGPYKAADQPIVTRSMEGVTVGQAIDPSIFTDPNTGKSYILYGNGSAAIAELSDDMMSVKPGTVRRLSGLTDFRESVVVSYREGKYHWTWSCDDAGSPNYHVNYGVSDSIDGAIAYKGTLLQKDTAKQLQGTAHQSDVHVTDANGDERWFMSYHRHYTPLGVFTSGLGYHRETAIDEITFGEDGLMQTMHPTDEGVSIVMADVTALTGAIDAAGKIENDGYTDKSWNAFQTALAAAREAKTTFLDSGLSQKDADAAATALTAAIEGLTKEEEPEPVPPATEQVIESIAVTKNPAKTEYRIGEDLDATGLEVTATIVEREVASSSDGEGDVSAQAVGDATERVLDPSEYELTGFDSTKASDQVVVTVQLIADRTKTATFTVSVKADEQPQPQPETATKEEREQLEQAIAKYEGKKLTSVSYTEASWKAYADALAQAKTVLADENATSTQVKDALRHLDEAYKALVKAQNKAEGAGSGKPGKPGRLTVTGAAVLSVGAVVVLLGAAGAGLTVWRKRRS